jgi:fructose-bisphosphate aldolase class II
VEKINRFGGQLDPSAKGVDQAEFAKAVPLGVTKVNIDTDGRLVWTRVHREHFYNDPKNFDFRKPGAEYVKAYAAFIANKSRALLSAGTLSQVKAALSAAAVR